MADHGDGLFDLETIDFMGPGFIEFEKGETGRFRFVAVEGWMDCRFGRSEGGLRVEFTWDGADDGDPVSGRGWAALEQDGSLRGRIFTHLADDSGFRASRHSDDQPGDPKVMGSADRPSA